VLNDAVGIEHGFITTIHAYNRRPADARHHAQGSLPRPRRGAVDDPDLDRRGQGRRPGCCPSFNGKLDGVAIRVPTPTTSR